MIILIVLVLLGSFQFFLVFLLVQKMAILVFSRLQQAAWPGIFIPPTRVDLLCILRRTWPCHRSVRILHTYWFCGSKKPWILECLFYTLIWGPDLITSHSGQCSSVSRLWGNLALSPAESDGTLFCFSWIKDVFRYSDKGH